MIKQIDLNCDLGEGFGVYRMGNDVELMSVVTSANIACGFHAGDPGTMRKTVKYALERKLSIGAHPGLPDLLGFGRRVIDISPEDAYDIVLYQVGALSAIVQAEGGSLRHVKPHGALYNMAARNKELADSIARAVYRFDSELILFGLAGSELTQAGERIGLQVAHEVFADRTYEADGSLTPRSHPNSLITDYNQAVSQVIRLVKDGKARATNGVDVALKADTVCIHGDGSNALELAQKIRKSLLESGILITPLEQKQM